MRNAIHSLMRNTDSLLQRKTGSLLRNTASLLRRNTGSSLQSKSVIRLFSNTTFPYLRKISFMFLIVLFPLLHAQGQLKTYINAEAGPAWDINSTRNGGNLFSSSIIYGSVGGLSIRQEVLPNLSIGTGLYAHQYSGGLNPTDERPHQPAVKSHGAILVPATVDYRLHIPNIPVSLTASLGYQFGFLTGEPFVREASSLITLPAGPTIQYTLTEEIPLNKTLHMVEAGVSADYRFPNNWQFSLRFSHFSGLREIKYSTVDYTTSAGNTGQVTYIHDGTRMQTTFNLGIPVSNLWENRDLRLHRRVENSLGRGGMVRNNRYIYFGGNLGALWRSFSASNPAIGARSLESGGFFRYANLHAGIYAGYMFNNVTGIDIGAYYQRSSLFNTIMYDHEDDLNTFSGSPMFLNVPVMFRYFYNMYDNKLFLVPSLGGVVLTHFSGPAYASGTAAFNYQTLSGDFSDRTATYIAGRPVRFGYSVRAALGVEYDIPTPFPLLLTWNLTYSHGFRDMEVTEITTSLNEIPEASTITYKGTGWMTSIGIRIPFSLDKDGRKCGALPRLRR